MRQNRRWRTSTDLLLTSLLAAMLLSSAPAKAGDSVGTFHAGVVFRKMAGFYTIGGFNAEYRPRYFLGGRLIGGLNLLSSVFGTGLFRRAIPVYCYEAYGRFTFRRTGSVRPFLQMNGGFAHASYDEQFRDHMVTSQTLLAPELGTAIHPHAHFDLHFSVGYNLITGNGSQGLGVIYPLYFQVRALFLLK